MLLKFLVTNNSFEQCVACFQRDKDQKGYLEQQEHFFFFFSSWSLETISTPLTSKSFPGVH